MANRSFRNSSLSRLFRLLSATEQSTCSEAGLRNSALRITSLHSLTSGRLVGRQFSSSSDQPPRQRASRGPVSYASLGLTALTGAGLLYWFQHVKEQKLQEASVKEAAVGKARIGGPFQLINQDGQPFTDRDLLGEYALLYFGFTSCPDICPDELEKVAAAIDHVGEKTGRKVQPVFISIDPERDSVQQVKSYVREFHPRMLGLTGSKEQVEAAARQYRVYYTKTSDSDDYLVDHSIITYLIDPQGNFVTFFGKNFTTEQLANSIVGHVKQWRDS